MADELRNAGYDVELVNGSPGEFTVQVDGKTVAEKGVDFPAPQEVLESVRRAAPVGGRV